MRAVKILVLAALLVSAWACSDESSYDLVLTPEAASLGVIDSLTVDVTTDFTSDEPIYTTTVAVAVEPAAIVSNLSSSDVVFADTDANTSFDSGPPPSYSFRPADIYGGATTQHLSFRCLAAGEATLSFAVTWIGGDPNDDQLTIENDAGIVRVICN
jgi:hypothetical protein